MQPTYLFYDLETSGLSCFDQVLQFAAIRTDLKLNVLKHEQLFVRLNSDLIPNPEAMITHRIPITTLTKGCNEFQAITKIHQCLNEPGTISLGYNTLGFDDEFLRFSFYRHLLPPYTHQYANSCKRMDLYPIVVMYYLYKPDCLHWPKIDRQISLRLEALSEANQLADGPAHDAMVDVEATLALARKLQTDQKMWDYVISFFDKTMDNKRQQQLTTYPKLGKEGLLIHPKLGRKNHYQSLVLKLGQHNHYKNQTLWLRLDNPQLADTTTNTIEKTSISFNKKPADLGFLLPTKERFLHHLSPERQAIIKNNRRWLEEHPKLFDTIKEYHCEYTYPTVENIDINATLYTSGFWTPQETYWMNQFHKKSWKARADSLKTAPSHRLDELALRLIGRHAYHTLNSTHQEQFDHYLDHCRETKIPKVNHKNQPRLTLKAALETINTLEQQESLDLEQHERLKALKEYLTTLKTSQIED